MVRRDHHEEVYSDIRTHLKEMPYCATASKPDFQTSVTSQALVADNRHDRKAETALPPTVATLVSMASEWVDAIPKSVQWRVIGVGPRRRQTTKRPNLLSREKWTRRIKRISTGGLGLWMMVMNAKTVGTHLRESSDEVLSEAC